MAQSLSQMKKNSLLNIGVSEVRINGNFDLEQRTSDQGAIEMAPSTTNNKISCQTKDITRR